jgi:ubiquitin carboxyl-terminal hydrolase 22/27/51
MKRTHLLELETKSTSEGLQDLDSVPPGCPHLERWLPHILSLSTLPSEDLDTYVVENPVHALHLASQLDENTSAILYGEEQKRAESVWNSSGIMDVFIPTQLQPIHQHYCTKELKKNKETIKGRENVNEDIHPVPAAEEAAAGTSQSRAAGSLAFQQLLTPTVAHAPPLGQPAITPSMTTVQPSEFLLAAGPNITISAEQSIVGANPAAVATPEESHYELTDDRFHGLRRAENQILLQRRNLLPKRDKRSKKKSKQKRVYEKPMMLATSSTVVDSKKWQDEAHRAKHVVEQWIHHFRGARREYWRHPSTHHSRNRFFGALEEESEQNGCCGLIRDDLMKCLECGFKGCAPHSLSPKSNQHIIMHMLTSNHHLAVTCGERCLLYCFGCGDVIHHPVFDTEKERIDLEQALPSWAWPEHPLLRSFDAFQFVNTGDQGIVWKGMVATYPEIVPKRHLEAARLVHQRLLCQKTNPTIVAPVGLYNLGNTCFMNGILQCLIHCQPLQKHFLKEIRHDYRSCRLFRQARAAKDASCLACELDLLFVQYFGSTIGRNLIEEFEGKLVEGDKGIPLVPSALLTELWKQPEMDHLKGYEQRDAHEFLQAFLDVVAKHAKVYERTIEENLAITRQENTKAAPTVDIVKHLFEGMLRSVSICDECGCKRSLQEPFINVSLPLSEDSILKYTNRKMNVLSCLNHFTAQERLGDPIECPTCRKKTSTKKQQTFSRLPKILCLHLKRFDATKNKKITDFVAFPAFGLDMGPMLPHWREGTMAGAEEKGVVYPQVLYDLYGTVNHAGTLNQGHYVSNIKVGDQWYHCNDAHISKSDEAEVLKSDGAYMLFYIRQSS